MSAENAVPQALCAFFEAHPRLALAFSGGVDSAYLLYAARACGCDVEAFYIQTAFQPEFERRDALRLAEQLGAPLTFVPVTCWPLRTCAATRKTAAISASGRYLRR